MPQNGPKRRFQAQRLRERLNIIDQMIRQGYSHSTIQALLSRDEKDGGIGVTPRAIRRYIRQVYEEWEVDALAHRVDRRNQRRSQLEGVLEMALREKPPNLKAAVQALERLCRVDGCYAPVIAQIEHSGNIEARVENMTSGEQRRRLEELFTRWAPPPPVKGNGHDGTNGEDRGHNGGNGHGS